MKLLERTNVLFFKKRNMTAGNGNIKEGSGMLGSRGPGFRTTFMFLKETVAEIQEDLLKY